MKKRRARRSGARTRALYALLVPLILGAAGILGFFLWQTWDRYARLGEETIVESTLLLVREKVDLIEQIVISADNAVFGLVDLSDPTKIEREWPTIEALAPSVRAVLVLDDSGRVVAHATGADEAEARQFLRTFLDRIVPRMELERKPLGQLNHLHVNLSGHSYLISYLALEHEGQRSYLVAEHDTDYIVHHRFPQLFATEEAKRHYNIVDEDNRRIYGRDLARSGDYLVGLRFPTTLYGWRLQVAPKQAPELESRGRTRRIGETALIGSSFVIIVLGVLLLLYATNKERKLNELKSEFIANVSHELKTPLTVVRMFAEMLLSKRVRNEDKQQQYLEIICRESERLSALIENVLDFSRLEGGKQKYDLRPGDLVDTARRTLETFRYRVEQLGVELSFHVEGSVPPLRIDEEGIGLAVMNLLDNAVKYGDHTPVELHVIARPHRVEVRVRDYGPGIPEDGLRRVFERFYRGKREETTRGTGIGLALVRHIAEAHGGRAFAQNAEGGGAIVSFTVPIDPSLTQAG